MTRAMRDVHTLDYERGKSYECCEKEANVSTSELARLREQLELECQALQHLMRCSAVASHSTINGRYRNLEKCHQQLKALVSEEEAVNLVVDIYNHRNISMGNEKQSGKKAEYQSHG